MSILHSDLPGVKQTFSGEDGSLVKELREPCLEARRWLLPQVKRLPSTTEMGKVRLTLPS